LELISDLKAFMEGEFDVDSSPHPAFHARCRELDHDNLQAPAPADLQVALIPRMALILRIRVGARLCV
jgi:hypothetical protein